MHPLHGPDLEARTEEPWVAGQGLWGAHRLAGAQERGQSSVICLPTPVVMPVGSRPITETRKQIDDSCLLKNVKKQKPAVYSDGNVNRRHACACLELEHHHVTQEIEDVHRIHPSWGSVSLSPVAGTRTALRGHSRSFCLLKLAPSAS